MDNTRTLAHHHFGPFYCLGMARSNLRITRRGSNVVKMTREGNDGKFPGEWDGLPVFCLLSQRLGVPLVLFFWGFG